MDLDDVRKVFADGDVTGVVVALGGKTKDVGKTMLTEGERRGKEKERKRERERERRVRERYIRMYPRPLPRSEAELCTTLDR